MSDPRTPPSEATSVVLAPATKNHTLELGSSGVTVENVPRSLTMFRVTREELFTLRGIGPTISLSFFGIMVGVAFALYTTLQGSTLDASTRENLNTQFIYARWLAAFFAIVAAVGYFRLWRVVSTILSQRPTAPTP